MPVSFQLPTKGWFFVHFKVCIGRIHINSSFSLHAMSLTRVYNAFLGVAQREYPNSIIVDFVCAMRLLTLIFYLVFVKSQKIQ